MEKAVILVALLSSFGLGMCFSLLGSVSVKLMPRLKIDKGKFGTLISAFMFTCLVASVIVGVSLDKIGYKPVTIFGFVATAICVFLLARGQTFGTVLGSCLLLGFGAMALNVAANTLLPVVLFSGKNPAAASNLGNTFFGLGLLITPLTISSLLKRISYENAISVMGVIVLLPAIPAIIAVYPKSQASFVFSQAGGLLVEPTIWVAAIMLFCYISLETSLCNWLPSFGKEVIVGATPGVDVKKADTSAQRLLSMFAVGMMAGRLVASQISGITTYGSWFIAGAALASAIIILLMMKTRSILESRILAILAGLTFAPCFPTIVGITFVKYHPEIYGSIFGIIFAIGLLGAVIVPKTIGNLSKRSSVQKCLKLLLPACLVLIVLALVMGGLKAVKS